MHSTHITKKTKKKKTKKLRKVISLLYSIWACGPIVFEPCQDDSVLQDSFSLFKGKKIIVYMGGTIEDKLQKEK